MKYLFVSYTKTNEFNDPDNWFKRINAYTGILDALAVSNTVISIEQIDYEGEVTKNGVHYYFNKYLPGERLFPYQLHRFIKSLRPDIVIVNGLCFPLQVIQLRLSLGRKTKIMIQHHAELPFKGIKKWVARMADYGVNAYIFTTKSMGMEWVQQGNLSSPQKINEAMEVSSVFAPINRACAQSKSGITGDPVFLWVGRLDKNKDPITVVSAFLSYLKIQPAARLYMIYPNDGLLPDIKKLLAASPTYKNNIILVGKLPHAELLYWYNSADFILSGSYYEGAGTAICEAMSCGCIPIVTAIEAFKMVTDNGRCGMLYEPGNSQALLNSLISIQYLNIVQKREIVLAHYRSTLSFEAIAGRFSTVAEGLLT